MAPISIEQGLQLEPLGDDKFLVLQTPFTWDDGRVIPGGLLMALSASAAYATILPDFSISSLQTHFLLGPSNKSRIELHVTRLSDGGRFATRAVHLIQDSKLKVHVTCSFARTASLTGRSMQHSVQRQTPYKLDRIVHDDLARGRTDLGPYMQYQHFPLYNPTTSTSPSPQELIHSTATTVSPAIQTSSSKLQLLGIILISDYHILNTPPTVHKLFNPSKPHDEVAKDWGFMTSLNHSILFHVHQGFRADEMCYVEAQTPWTRGRRGEINSRIFSKDGVLIATCKQEGYYALKGEEKKRAEGKL